jgi:glycosyltransferase involved in cell wall biosynthesis
MKRIRSVNKVLAVSNGAAECLHDYGYKNNIDIIRNGTDLVYPADKAERLIERVNESYKLTPSETVFLSVGRIVPNKKLNLALDALKIVSDREHKFKLLIVGAGPEEENLKAQVADLRLSDNVIFTGKIMDREFLSAHYLRGDLFMLPSTFDTASLAPIEAAAMKLPTIMNAGCSSAEILTDGENGLLAEENPEAWAERIIWSIDHKSEMKKMKESAYKQVFRTWESVAEEVKQYYIKTIEEYKA